MTLLGAVASYFLKKLSESNGLSVILKNINLYFGGGLYFITAVINVYLLKFLDYSLVLPLTSLTYIWTMFISYKFLGEKITKKKIAGTAFILFGAVLIGFS
jgi:drug/metabolite transporter (DMT)-like permease